MQGISNERCDMEYVVWWQSQCLSKSIEEEPKKGSTSKIFEVHIIYIYIYRERERDDGRAERDIKSTWVKGISFRMEKKPSYIAQGHARKRGANVGEAREIWSNRH